MRPEFLIATANEGKRREIAAVLADLPVEWRGLRDYPDVPEVVEDGSTFAENAAKKALHYARLTGLWTLADDSGLEVDALGGAPGVHSARFAGTGRDEDNNAKLVESLRGIPPEKRAARFVCCLAFADSAGVRLTAQGRVSGRIIDEPRGGNGFGYDPHFWLPDRWCTTAELAPADKNSISHRGQALRELLPGLRHLLEALGTTG